MDDPIVGQVVFECEVDWDSVFIMALAEEIRVILLTLGIFTDLLPSPPLDHWYGARANRVSAALASERWCVCCVAMPATYALCVMVDWDVNVNPEEMELAWQEAVVAIAILQLRMGIPVLDFTRPPMYIGGLLLFFDRAV